MSTRPGGKPRLDGRRQHVDALPGHRRHQHRPFRPRPALGEIWQPSALLGVEPIDLVPHFDQRRLVVGVVLRIDAELAKNILNVLQLRLGVLVRNVADMQDHVGLDHLLERGAEGRDQHGRQVGDEADGVGKDDARAVRQRRRRARSDRAWRTACRRTARWPGSGG